MNIKKEISCGLIPVYQDDEGQIKILLLQAQHGAIGFPKGKMEAGESFLDTAIREAYEELGIVPEYLLEDPMLSENYCFKRRGVAIEKTVHYFIASVSTPLVSLQEEEVKDSYWCSYEEALEKISYPECKEVLKKAIPSIQGNF